MAKVPTDTNQAEAIRDLLRAGWPSRRIADTLGISQRTYMRRVAELRAAGVSLDPVRPRLCAAS